MVPQEHLDFARKLLIDHGVPLQEGEDDNSLKLLGWTEATATPQVEIALQHDRCVLIANALGTPPPDMIKHIHDAGRKVAALCGSPYQARKHVDAGVDIVIAQGGEGGGHCGEVGSIVLWPQVVKEVAPTPVLAAGGIGNGAQIASALAMGCQGAWSGSQWLMVEEAHVTPQQQETYIAAGSRDTVRSRSFTGKPCRMLRNDWTEAWEQPDSARPAADAAAVHGVGDGGGRDAPVAGQVQGRRLQPRGPGRRPVHEGREERPGRPAPRRGVPRGVRAPERPQRRHRLVTHATPDRPGSTGRFGGVCPHASTAEWRGVGGCHHGHRSGADGLGRRGLPPRRRARDQGPTGRRPHRPRRRAPGAHDAARRLSNSHTFLHLNGGP